MTRRDSRWRRKPGNVLAMDLAQACYVPVLDDHGRLPRVITREEAMARGYSRRAIEHRLATKRWRRVLPRTYLTDNTLTWPDRLNAALRFAGPEALLTGAAALADLGLATVPPPERVLLLVPPSNHVRPAGWVRLRRTDRMPQPADVPGPRRAHLARAVADLALERRVLDDVRALVAQALRARLCTLAQLQLELDEGPRNRSANLRVALEDMGAGAWSAPEARAGRILRRAKMRPFEQNALVTLPDGTSFYVDFLWPELHAVLEIDSNKHHWVDPSDQDRTSAKASKLQAWGYRVMSRRPWTLRNEREFVADVREFLAGCARSVA